MESSVRIHIAKNRFWTIRLHLRSKLEAKDVLPNKPHAGRQKGRKITFVCPWWPWHLTFDLDLQIRPSEGPNTYTVWIWRKSVQLFRIYFIYKQKSHRQRQKQNLTQFTACGNQCSWLPVYDSKALSKHFLRLDTASDYQSDIRRGTIRKQQHKTTLGCAHRSNCKVISTDARSSFYGRPAKRAAQLRISAHLPICRDMNTEGSACVFTVQRLKWLVRTM